MAKEFTSDSFESATSLQAAPASASFGNHHWYSLPEKLEALLGVVPESSAVLERTTVLTWLYQNKGVMAFEEVACRVGGERTITVKKKLARRALRGHRRKRERGTHAQRTQNMDEPERTGSSRLE